ncbi:MAG: hypothetical protein ABI954_14370 [Pyrinomonadaceae bacterium]
MMSNFEEIFELLKPIFQTYETDLAVKIDQPGKYYLISKKPFNKKELWFGGVEIKKNYVSFHLVPVYLFPEMIEKISAGLKKRMQGKACFNFKKTDEQIFGELANLTLQGFEIFKQKELV